MGARLLDDAARAAKDIDELLQLCLSERRPIYLEIAQDVQLQACSSVADWSQEVAKTGNLAATEEALVALLS